MFDHELQTDDVLKTYLTCGLEEDRVGLPVSRVKEILDPKPITSLPHTPEFLLGYIDIRGEGILVVDLRLLLARPYQEDKTDTRIIVLWVEDGENRVPVGLRTDRVFEVTRLDDDKLDTFSQNGLLNWDARMVAGVGRRDGGFITVLDLDRMLSSDVISEFHENVSEEKDQ